VAVKVQGGIGYWVGASDTATLTIADNEGTTVEVTPGLNGAESGRDGTFTFTRSSSTGSLTVNYAVNTTTSTATAGSDYSAPATTGTITFDSGVATVTLSVVPIDDDLPEATETVVVNLQSGDGYSIGAHSGATISIVDDDTPTISISGVTHAAEPSQDGVVTLTRTNTTGALTVNYTNCGGRWHKVV
jgi:hypothetical protein